VHSRARASERASERASGYHGGIPFNVKRLAEGKRRRGARGEAEIVGLNYVRPGAVTGPRAISNCKNYNGT